jgi:hypothetical protein
MEVPSLQTLYDEAPVSFLCSKGPISQCDMLVHAAQARLHTPRKGAALSLDPFSQIQFAFNSGFDLAC